jgi:hypothetical protein
MCSVDADLKIRKQQGSWLAAFRKAAGYRSARAAALANAWPESTYRAHEAGERTIGLDDAQRYARRFQSKGVKVTAKTILFGDPSGVGVHSDPQTTAPLVGYVGAGSEAHFYAVNQGSFLDEVPAPQDSTARTVAVEIRGDSLGSLFDRWIVFYDDVRSPVTHDLIGQLCVVGLPDERVLLKKIRPGSKEGLYRLLSEREPEIRDVSIDWAAKVKNMVPR